MIAAGCAWRMLAHDFSAWQTVYHYFRLWRKDGTWKRIHDASVLKLVSAKVAKPKPVPG